MTIRFALVPGEIFRMTRSLSYVVTVHLLFDLVVFLVIATPTTPGGSAAKAGRIRQRECSICARITRSRTNTALSH